MNHRASKSESAGPVAPAVLKRVMVAPLIILAVVAVLVGAFVAPPARPTRIRPIEPTGDTSLDDPYALAVSDPVEALKRYGTPEVADQLRARGIDLAALGYRDGGEG